LRNFVFLVLQVLMMVIPKWQWNALLTSYFH